MIKPVRVRPRADNDIDELAHYIAIENPNAALRFLDAIEAAYNKIGGFPAIGSPRFAHIQLLENVRVWAVKDFENHLIFYVERQDYIDVIRVLHSARDIPACLISD
jgi:toxin ParE1/3/4